MDTQCFNEYKILESHSEIRLMKLMTFPQNLSTNIPRDRSKWSLKSWTGNKRRDKVSAKPQAMAYLGPASSELTKKALQMEQTSASNLWVNWSKNGKIGLLWLIKNNKLVNIYGKIIYSNI